MHMAGYELSERVNYRNDRLFKVAVFHAGGAPQCAGTRHIAARSCSLGTVNRHNFPRARFAEQYFEQLLLGGSLTQSAAPSYAVNSASARLRAGVYTRGNEYDAVLHQ